VMTLKLAQWLRRFFLGDGSHGVHKKNNAAAFHLDPRFFSIMDGRKISPRKGKYGKGR
jgi:hypothetical protein